MVPAVYCVDFGRSIGFNVTPGRFLDRKFGGIWDPFPSGWKFLKFITSSVQRCLRTAYRYLSKPIRHLLSYPTFRQFNRQTYKHKKHFPTMNFQLSLSKCCRQYLSPDCTRPHPMSELVPDFGLFCSISPNVAFVSRCLTSP